MLHAWAHLPENLAEFNWKNPSDGMHTALQAGLRTDVHGFEWMATHPKVLQNFNVYMSTNRQGRSHWLDCYPLEQDFLVNTTTTNGLAPEHGDGGSNDEAVFFVDVGGAVGSEIIEIKRRYPKIQGRLILQDQADTIQMVGPNPPFENMVHDFFTPNPVKGQ